jgi:hypothetical protein
MRTADDDTLEPDEVEQNFLYYPNPADKILTIRPNFATGTNFTVRILNTAGKVAFEDTFDRNENDVEIEVEKIPAGVYLIIIQANGRISETGKVVIIHTN